MAYSLIDLKNIGKNINVQESALESQTLEKLQLLHICKPEHKRKSRGKRQKYNLTTVLNWIIEGYRSAINGSLRKICSLMLT